MLTISDKSPIRFQDHLPQAVDVVVIGGGVIGVSTALYLAERGQSVLLCEKGRIAGEQSSRNWGWIRQQGRDEDELPIMMESLTLWQDLAQRVGEDIGFTQRGIYYLADDEKALADHEAWVAIAKQHQLDSHIISGAELDKRLDSGKPGQFAGALVTPSDGRAEPSLAVPALARLAQKSGVTVRENCAARVVETTNGAVSAVVTEDGPVQCQAVLCAGGAWSSLFLRNLGISLPQLAVKSCVARTTAAGKIFDGNASASNLSFRPRLDGGYTVALGDTQEHFISADSFRYFFDFMPVMKESFGGMKLRLAGSETPFWMGNRRWSGTEKTPFEETRVLNPQASPAMIAALKKRLAERLPALADVDIAETWAGMIDAMPDVVPVMDKAPGIEGLFIGTGFSGHGFGIGPGAGKVLADMIQGRDSGYNLSRFRFSRFTDGSKLKLGPAL
ncbi:NAD(P)/FAD-dependent oxidoreductase [Aestuariispira ectoiniformans]|uniref:NAD(P)/FAD-dependent oxidoreductase n=1 Tax=Aestuariispira ectoiniformans TaxID=2775080 RepID=UPI00223B8C1E|nr:FAD-binding oxidoreductase [Aestuariispira ectoiniformans]